MKDDDQDNEEDVLENQEGAHAAAVAPDSVGSSRRSSPRKGGEFVHKVHQQKVKQKLRQLQELMAMVQVRPRTLCSCSAPNPGSFRSHRITLDIMNLQPDTV